MLKDKWLNASAEISKIYPKDSEGNIILDYKCEYYALDNSGLHKKQKCKCPLHETMRQDQKAINFGIPYGLSAKGLAADLSISIEEAEVKFNAFYAAFPKIKGTLDAFGAYGTNNGFIRTIAPFRRKRYFPYWKGPQTPKNLLGQIERASKNAPIQGCNADFCKMSLIMLRKWINSNGLRDKVCLYLQLHDEIAISCHKDVAELVLSKTVEVMEYAAEYVLKNKLLKVEAEISDTW